MKGDLNTAASIQNALHIEGTIGSVAAVKEAVARSIRAVDASVEIETTDYFNHSFAPDFVLKWGHSSAGSERYVFLRPNGESEWITEELPRLSRHHPLVYGLFPTVEDEHTETLALKSAEAETLVTDPSAVDQLASIEEKSLESLVSRTLVRGGKGLVDDSRASQTTHGIANGFKAARDADADLTRSAIETAEGFLRPAEASLVLRFLRAAWVSSGGATNDFPAPKESTVDPGDDGLTFLIELEEIDDQEFWRSLGESLTIERLINLDLSASPVNLQHIVEANLDRLWARAFRVLPDQPRLNEADRDLIWRMERNCLALSGRSFTAFLGPQVENISHIKAKSPLPDVTVEELRERARAIGIAIESFGLTNGQTIVTVQSANESDAAREEDVSAVAHTLGSPSVQRASIRVGGRNIELDFTDGTASARTSGQPPLTDILGMGLPLLWPLSRQELSALVSMMSRARDQQAIELFPLEPDESTPRSET
jgi:hypothetical protein